MANNTCSCYGRAGDDPYCSVHGTPRPEPPTLKQREVAALERIAAALEAFFQQYEWWTQREAQR